MRTLRLVVITAPIVLATAAGGQFQQALSERNWLLGLVSILFVTLAWLLAHEGHRQSRCEGICSVIWANVRARAAQLEEPGDDETGEDVSKH